MANGVPLLLLIAQGMASPLAVVFYVNVLAPLVARASFSLCGDLDLVSGAHLTSLVTGCRPPLTSCLPHRIDVHVEAICRCLRMFVSVLALSRQRGICLGGL